MHGKCVVRQTDFKMFMYSHYKMDFCNNSCKLNKNVFSNVSRDSKRHETSFCPAAGLVSLQFPSIGFFNQSPCQNSHRINHGNPTKLRSTIYHNRQLRTLCNVNKIQFVRTEMNKKFSDLFGFLISFLVF